MLAVAVVAVILARSSAASGDWLRAAGIALAAFGGTLNLVVICANGGRMPIRTGGRRPASAGYVAMTRRTRLPWLGDWMDIGRWLISPGDVCLFAGMAIALGARLYERMQAGQ